MRITDIPEVRVGTGSILLLALSWSVAAASYAFPWNIPVFVIGFGSTAAFCASMAVCCLELRLIKGVLGHTENER